MDSSNYMRAPADPRAFYDRIEACEAKKYIEEEEGPQILWRGTRISMAPLVSTEGWGTAEWARWGRQKESWCIRPPGIVPRPSAFKWRVETP